MLPERLSPVVEKIQRTQGVKRDQFVVGIFYFAVLLGIALWVRDIPNQPDNFLSPQEFVALTGVLNDPIYSMTAAIDIASNGWISSANAWILNLWPPGFILLEALIIKLLGVTAPVIFVLQVLAAMLFSLVLLLIFAHLKTCASAPVAFILPLSVFLFPVSRLTLLEPAGVSLGETFAIGFFLLGVLFIARAFQFSRLRFAVYGGLCLALAAYFRSQFELILLALTGLGVVLAVAILIVRSRNTIYPHADLLLSGIIALVLLTANAATIPWRAYHWVNHGTSAWVMTANLVFENSVKTYEVLAKDGGTFVYRGGGNLVCRIDVNSCGDVANAKRLFIKTFVNSPVQWVELKLRLIGKYWFSSSLDWGAPIVEPTIAELVTNAFIFIALLLNFALLITKKLMRHRLWTLLVWFDASMLSAYLVIFTFVHFEARYFYFPKIYLVTMLLVVSSIYFQPVKVLSTSVER